MNRKSMTGYDPRFDDLAGIDLKFAQGRKKGVNPYTNMLKAQNILQEKQDNLEEYLRQEELDTFFKQSLDSGNAAQKRRDMLNEKLALRKREWRIIANGIAKVVLESLPFDPLEKEKFERGIFKNTSNLIVNLFESNDINTFMLTKSSDNVKKYMANFIQEADEQQTNGEDDQVDNKKLESDTDDDTADTTTNDDGTDGEGTTDTTSADTTENNDNGDDVEIPTNNSSETNELSKDIADAIKIKAIQLVKKEIENAKQSDEIEDDIHDVKSQESGSDAKQQENNQDMSGATNDDATASSGNLPASNAPNQVPADTTSPNTPATANSGTAQDHQPTEGETVPNGGNADPSVVNGKTEEDKNNGQFSFGEDYLDLKPFEGFHIGHKFRTPTFANQFFGKIITESAKQIFAKTGKRDMDKVLGNATVIYCIYECLNSMNLINEDNSDTIFKKLIA